MTEMHVVSSPTPDDASHAEIVDLTYDSRKSKQAMEYRVLLAVQLCLWVEGPFLTQHSE